MPSGIALAALIALVSPAGAQPAAGAGERPYEIVSVDVTGVDDEATRGLVAQTSGLRAGQRVALPSDPLFGDAVRRIYGLGLFDDVDVVVDRMAGDGVFLQLRVEPVPRLASVDIVGATGTVSQLVRAPGETPGTVNIGPRVDSAGARAADPGYRQVRRSERDVLLEQIALQVGRPVRAGDIERGRLIIRDYYRDQGYLLADAATETSPADDGRVALRYIVSRGERPEVVDVRFVGNRAFGESTLRRRLQNTPEARWWRFWSRDTFDRTKFGEDIAAVESFYHDRGYYGARVVSDSFWVDRTIRNGSPGVVVQLTIEEGPRYVIRDLSFEGNTLFTDVELSRALGVEAGEYYSRSRLERNLYYNADHTDVASLYSDRGHLRFNVEPYITEAPGDSLDLRFEIEEGEVYDFGRVTIAGNTRTNDHVIRRELRTIPGQTYSRQAIERSVRELIQLNYFDQTTLAQGPAIAVNDADRDVDLTYNLTESSSDQLELSGGWGGSSGLILQAGVTFNNFSARNLFNRGAWRPLPMGDGQKLSLAVTTYGTRRQSYQLSFTEPWFRGRQTPVGFALSYTSYRGGVREVLGDEGDTTQVQDRLGSISSRVFYRQQLRWPDDFFQTGTDLGLRFYDIAGGSLSNSYGLPEGTSRELTLSQSLTRNALNSPLFPTAGSNLGLSVTLAAPIPGFIQYHKWDFNSAWYAPLTRRAALSFSTRLGYIGSLTGEDVQFQRFLVGGSPLDVQGSFRGFGKDLVFLRGYPVEVVGPRRDGEAVGGRILTKYGAELQMVAVQTAQLSLAPYLFAEAANTYDSFDSFDPSRLYRSAGVGLRVYLPILGLVDLNYGYQIDPYVPLTTNDDGRPKWRFQFSLGAGGR